MPKFEGALAVNSILTKTQKLYEGDLVGPGSIAADSEGIVIQFPNNFCTTFFPGSLHFLFPPPPIPGRLGRGKAL